MAVFTLEWAIGDKDAGKLVREFLKEQEISKAALTDIKSNGKILLNGENVTVRKVLEKNDVLVVEFPPERRSSTLPGEDIPLDIMYEDDYLIVVNKGPGMNTIPSREHPTGSLANAIIGYYEKKGFPSTFHVVTRLDRNTTGLVLIAKHRHIHHLFSKYHSLVNRIYEGFAAGVFSNPSGTIEEPIRRNPDSIIEREVHPSGQYACTHYEVLRQFDQFAHVKFRLETGRTHQIRVHLSYIGHPLLGDDLYGGPLDSIDRQALHCKEISFIHPIKKEKCIFEAPLPADMEAILKNG